MCFDLNGLRVVDADQVSGSGNGDPTVPMCTASIPAVPSPMSIPLWILPAIWEPTASVPTTTMILARCELAATDLFHGQRHLCDHRLLEAQCTHFRCGFGQSPGRQSQGGDTVILDSPFKIPPFTPLTITPEDKRLFVNARPAQWMVDHRSSAWDLATAYPSRTATRM